ncbi:hypothetical protein BCR44DRAFT_1146829 [Catenaria anguillulae PL171]|uniref:Uncharacterized protein n=1 Tax=Catenaria anguillulae PL171 TaxID=765915 RepID=A0A1Y2HKL7_9FUNG|nr:hypothetical protein BCR44DRAFT_1146829 [Catenaria anguillulae PL171]
MRPRLNARLWNEIALVTSQLEQDQQAARHQSHAAAGTTAVTTATATTTASTAVSHSTSSTATHDTAPNLAINGLTVSPPPSSSPTKATSPKSPSASPGSGSVLGPWDNVSALIAQAAHTPAAQPDRLMHDVAITSLRNAASYALSTLASASLAPPHRHHLDHDLEVQGIHDACWAPLLRILDSAWTQLTTLTTHLAHSTSDLLTLTNTDLPALIGLTRALDDAFIPLPATAFADQVRWLSQVSGPSATLRLQGIAATLARIETDTGATGARLRKRLAGYWTRTPFCAESIHSGAMGLVRNALALAVWETCLVPDEHAAMGVNGAGGMMMAHPMPAAGAPIATTRQAAARLRALSTDGMPNHHHHHGHSKQQRHALPPPRSFRVAWDRISSAKALVDLGATGIPNDVLEDITTLCLHHFHPLYAAQDGRVPPDALASDLYTCTLAWALCEKLPLEGMVPILFAVFRPASPATMGPTAPEGSGSGVSFSNTSPSTSPTTPQQRANRNPTPGHATFSVPVLTAAADCLSILTLALTSRAGPSAHAAIAQIQSFLIDILTTPHPAFAAAHTPDILSSFRASLARALAHTARNLPSDRTTTLLYSLIRNASGDIAQAKLDNCTTGVAAVVAAVRRTDAFDTAVPFLTRLLVMGDQKPSEGTDSTSLDTRGCLDLLARVAKSAPLEVFAEVGRFVASYARSHVSDDVATKIVMNTVASLSKDAEPDQKRVVLVTLLRYFCDKAAWAVETFGDDKDKIRASVAHLVGLLASVCRSVYVSDPAGAAEVDAKPVVPVQQQQLQQVSVVPSVNGQGGWACPSDTELMNHVRAAWHAIIVLDLAKSESAVDSTADLASATPMPTFSPVVAAPILAPFLPTLAARRQFAWPRSLAPRRSHLLPDTRTRLAHDHGLPHSVLPRCRHARGPRCRVFARRGRRGPKAHGPSVCRVASCPRHGHGQVLLFVGCEGKASPVARSAGRVGCFAATWVHTQACAGGRRVPGHVAQARDCVSARAACARGCRDVGRWTQRVGRAGFAQVAVARRDTVGVIVFVII